MSPAVSEAQLVALREGFEKAAFDSTLWLPALEALARATGSSYAELVGFTPQAPAFNWVTPAEDAAWRDFTAFDGGDPRLNFRLAAGLRAAPGEVVHEAHYEAVAPTLAGDAYLDFCEKWGMTFGCQASLMADERLLIGMSILRSRRDGPTTEAHRDLFAALAPHVRTAVRTQAAIEGQGGPLIRGALEALSAPAFMLDAFGRVASLTPAAEALAKGDPRLRLVKGALRGVAWPEDEALRIAIAAAARPSLSAAGESAVVLRGPDATLEPLVLDVLPLPRTIWSFGFQPSVLVVARRAGRARARVAGLLAQTYGLTAAEADIAEQLSRGVSREEVAAGRGVALSTVRIQIKAIFRKMDVSREGELVARVGLFR